MLLGDKFEIFILIRGQDNELISEAEMVVIFVCIYNFEASHTSSLNYVLSA